MIPFSIRDLDLKTETEVRDAAEMLVRGFAENWPDAWPAFDHALEEVAGFMDEGRIIRGAYDPAGTLLGWIGGISTHSHAWELHPLVVRPDRQRQGIGRALLADFEEQVRARGGLVVYLGTDDESGMTSLSQEDLFADPIGAVAHIRNLKRHPYEFYQRLGYVIVGVLPDVNGPGKPDILMAKRVREATYD